MRAALPRWIFLQVFSEGGDRPFEPLRAGQAHILLALALLSVMAMITAGAFYVRGDGATALVALGACVAAEMAISLLSFTIGRPSSGKNHLVRAAAFSLVGLIG